jgi:hypothetical protein
MVGGGLDRLPLGFLFGERLGKDRLEQPAGAHWCVVALDALAAHIGDEIVEIHVGMRIEKRPDAAGGDVMFPPSQPGRTRSNLADFGLAHPRASMPRLSTRQHTVQC